MDKTLYDFHNSFDKITLNSVERILKIPSLKRSREYFHIDFLGDIGIINLLRLEYLNSANFAQTFDLFQSTRLEPKSHRYESLFALLVIAAAGTVIGGVILDIYQTEKEKIYKLISKEVIDRVLKFKDKKKLNKFCNIEPTEIFADLVRLKSCFVSRLMLDSGEINETEYFQLVDYFITGSELKSLEVLKKHGKFLNDYNQSKERIDENLILLGVKSYAKGTVIKFLEQEDVKIPYDENVKTANILRGMPASPGFARGKSHIYDKKSRSDKSYEEQNIICIDSKDYSPDLIDLLTMYDGVVTWNCGLTGHIPLVCRGMGKGCVIISELELKKLKDNDDMMLSGNQGIIFTGLYVKE
ncbi:PEP-utilizing enzyme [Prolixibacter denitrificans]|uniref:PEP-utilizing family enzyme n=1 Tax=Prolixibacter denitrificans TaxID=1541063 RepID=A0A2P8CCR7_9BACT|nr:PEP-utilizing enzyme [Prolixibacter denitrificans]PSK82764.1 PEP-utilizing family enzyme [Prolixibacter denitrificans]GET21418.1 hypothetical protein JCM18694_16640 [Prolixibacter denitrificans]